MLLILLLVSGYVYCKDKTTGYYHLTAHNLLEYPNYLYENWKYSEADSLGMSSLTLDDSKWDEVNPFMEFSKVANTKFKGVGWFRLHFIADSSVTGKPLAISLKHFGASEIYFDGILLKSFGIINGPDSSRYYDPHEVPFIITIKDIGVHVLAVRYANYHAEKNFNIYGYKRVGFEMMIGFADDYISIKNKRSTLYPSMLMLMGGIFLALCLLHLFLFFYHRTDPSNLFFSLFMFCIACMFIIAFVVYSTASPSVALNSIFIINPLIIVACISLSGFIKILFFKNNWRFILVSIIGCVCFLMQIFGFISYTFLTAVLIISVSFEAVFTIIFGMIKRVKGAGIIGTGILFFTLLILTLFTLSIASGGKFDINDSTENGQIWELILILALLSIPVSMSLYQAWRFASVNKDLGLQFDQVKLLSQKTLEQEKEKKKILETQKEKLEEEVMLQTAELRKEKKKSDDLLLNILPSEVANELKENGSAEAKHFDEVTVMFTDFKGFTQISENLSPTELVSEIHDCFKAFDHIIEKHNIEKIKTIGDSYMCAGGLPVSNKTNANDIVNAAIEIQHFMEQHSQQRKSVGKEIFEIRIGIHTGPVVAGIVGVKKFAYDIWGDTVNIASRMESSGEVGKVNISGSTYKLVKDKFSCIYRGKIYAKNKGEIDMYFVEGF